MNILLTGANGQLGTELQRILDSGQAEIGPIPSVYADACVTCTDVGDLDITCRQAVLDFVAQGCFDLIVNCAAMTNVDGCEAAEEAAFSVNASGPENLAIAARQTGAKLVQVSTDYVFAGTEARPRVEADAVGPVSAYGRSKLAGERAVARECERFFIVRTAWLYGYVGKNFVKTMLRLGASHDSVTVVDDQLGNPTSANDLAYSILRIAEGEDYGIYHCTNEGTCSWADFAQAIMECGGLDCRVERCTSAQYKQMNPASATRPAYSSLENAHLAETCGNQMRPWRQALGNFFQNYGS